MGWAGGRKTTDKEKNPQVLLKGPKALQLPSMAESSVLSLSPRATVGSTEAFLQALCTQVVLSQRKAEDGSHTVQHWNLAVRNGQFLKYIQWEQQADTKRNLYGSAKRSPLLLVTVQLLLGCLCPALGYLHSLLPTPAMSRGGGFWLTSTPPCLVTGQIKPPTSLGVICDKI